MTARRSRSARDDPQALALTLPGMEGEPVLGEPDVGTGPWLVARFEVAGLFSLKSSLATSSVGKTLVTPTPYAIKMGVIDAAFRAGLTDEECAALTLALARTAVRIAPTAHAVVTHTFVKVRQEPKTPQETPYISNIAYREIAHCLGEWQWAFDLGHIDPDGTAWLETALAHVTYVGKRGSLIQFRGTDRRSDLDRSFGQPLDHPGGRVLPARSHVAVLDDFGPDATLEVLSSFSEKRARLEKDRRFDRVVLPVGVVDTGPGFTEYSAGE